MSLQLLKLIIVGIAIGFATGIGVYTFVYAKGYSYLSNNPASCANCHIMNDQYNAWQKSSHHAVATCNDCHTPHDFFGKYYTKASNGFWHSFYFTTGRYPEHIQIKASNRKIAEDACLECHQDVVHAISNTGCLRCHWDVGHMK